MDLKANQRCIAEKDTSFGVLHMFQKRPRNQEKNMSNKTHPLMIDKYRPKIQKMRLLDDDFMRAVFHENIAATETVLQIIMEKDDLRVQEVRAQSEIKNIYGRSVRLDVYATDKDGRRYDIEIQRADKGAGEKRARYHQSIMDTNHLPAGSDPSSLPETYVIFFTEHDVRGRGCPIYHIERIITETGEWFDDGEHIIYVNGAYQNEDTALGALIADFRESDPSKVRHESLAQSMRYLKESEEGVSRMCRIMEDIVQEERQEARQEARQEEFLRLIKKLWEQKFSLAQMTTLSDRTEEEVVAALNELGLSIPN